MKTMVLALGIDHIMTGLGPVRRSRGPRAAAVHKIIRNTFYAAMMALAWIGRICGDERSGPRFHMPIVISFIF